MKYPDFPLLENNYPLNYREDICRQMFAFILETESFSFIGMRDNCKINVLRFMGLRKDVQKKYLGAKVNDYLFVLVNLNELPEVTLLNFYHLIGTSLVETLQKRKYNTSYLNNLFIDNPLVLFKALKEDLAKITVETGKTIVFLFNNFNIIHKINLQTISHNLVALRNAARYKTVFVFGGTRPFIPDEFFFKKIVWMKPFFGEDAILVTKRNMQRYKVILPDRQVEEIVGLSGGHGGLIKFIVQSVAREGPKALTLEALYKNSDICFQCERLLAPLTEIEKAKLKTGVRDELLLNLSLQKEQDGKFTPFTPLLTYHFNCTKDCLAPMVYDKENEVIYFWGKSLNSTFTSREQRLLKLLIDSPRKVFGREELMKEIWGEDEFPSDWALDKLISRVRQKLGDTSAESKYFKTIRGKGITLL